MTFHTTNVNVWLNLIVMLTLSPTQIQATLLPLQWIISLSFLTRIQPFIPINFLAFSYQSLFPLLVSF